MFPKLTRPVEVRGAEGVEVAEDTRGAWGAWIEKLVTWTRANSRSPI